MERSKNTADTNPGGIWKSKNGDARAELNFVRERLIEGGLKKGEREILERRENRLAEAILKSDEK